MAKTKRQKQQEAIARNRKNLPTVQLMWQRYQPGGDWYKMTCYHEGKEQAEKEAAEATKRLHNAAAEAQCDVHGNPITKEWNDV